jgi:hypothetical protein
MIPWPKSKRFALSIMDDTDRARLERIRPFYDALIERGMRTTKTVWALPCPVDDPSRGDTLEDTPYRNWIVGLQALGFEIGWHGARSGGTPTIEHALALERFRTIFGGWPHTYGNHEGSPEAIYWGAERFDDPLLRDAYRRLIDRTSFSGSTAGTPYHWEGLCKQRLRYVRGFTFADTITSRADPWMPYSDPRRPGARRWFSASDGSDVDRFVQLLAPHRLDELENSGECCIVHTHVADGFVRHGKLDPRVEAVLDDLASREGWYVPVSSLLAYREVICGKHSITIAQHRRLEWIWALDQLKSRMSEPVAALWSF